MIYKTKIIDVLLPLLCFSLGYMFIFASDNLPLKTSASSGWLIISIGFVFIGLTLFEKLTKCDLCKRDKDHTMAECIEHRVFHREASII